MHIAVLVTNTDRSDFAARHPRDGEKFRALLAPLRPGWRVSAFDVAGGAFPATMDGIDGVIITGSPASVHDDEPWVRRLLDLIRDLAARETPVYGACFGHQAIAMALGGHVGPNPGGWVLGLVETALDEGADPPGPIRLYAAHTEQVTELPDGARIVGTTPGCPFAAFAIGTAVLTTQYHPEMTHGFISALVEETAGKVPAETTAAARASLARQADTGRIAAGIVAFFERAAQDSAASRSIAVT